MEHWKLARWCRIAVSKIIYPPDRKAVFEELRQHMDDRSDLFLEQGFSQEEAIERTLQAMGDPKELAPQLAAIHRPFWGFVWSITKWFARIAVAAMILAVISYHLPQVWSDFISWIRYGSDTSASQEWDPYEMTEHPSHGQQLVHLEPGCQYSDSGYTVTLTDAAIWQYEPDETELGVLYFRLRITNPLPWSSAPRFTQFLTARDSLGNKYMFYSAHNAGADSSGGIWGNLSQNGPFVWHFDGTIDHHFTKDVQWIDICYEQDGRTMALRIDLTGGGAR